MHERGYFTTQITRIKEPLHGVNEETFADVAGRRIVYLFIPGV
jgi:hypothetical protein